MATIKTTLIFYTLLVAVNALPQKPRGFHKNHRKSYETMIVGGEPAKQGELPYQISLEYFESQFCGGSFIIVNNTHLVITAAHCVDDEDTEGLTVTAGDLKLSDSSGHEQRREVTKIIVHKEFNDDTNENDIALLLLDEPFVINENVAPILIPKQGQNTTDDVLVSGWGDLESGGTSPDSLQKVQISTIDDGTCQKAYPEEKITSSMLCAGLLDEGGKDSCQGDSGGPLRSISGDYLAGIVSWGYGCARPGRPGVNTEVSYFTNWIENNASKL